MGDNRGGADIPRGNQAHYKGTGRVYGLVNQAEGVAHRAIIILWMDLPLLLCVCYSWKVRDQPI